MLTANEIKNARNELTAALLLVQQKTGISFNIGIIRFDATSMRCKLEGNVVSAGAPVMTKVDVNAAALTKVAGRTFGASFDATKSYRSKSLGIVKIVGYNARAIKYPFIVQTLSGKRYKMQTMAVQLMVADGEVA